MAKLLNIGILVSGAGTNLQAILDACAEGSLKARVVCVVSNQAEAYGLERARLAGIPALCLDHRGFAGRRSYDEALVEELRRHDVELVVLAGFMRIVTSVLLDAFPMRVMNIHPALLPAFPGLNVQRQALQYGVKVSGCTVHFVDAGTDTGPIIAQACVPVLEHDTEETLTQRIMEQEHRIYPEAIRLYAEGRLKVVERRVVID